MFLNNYGKKANVYAQHKKDEGTVLLAYREFKDLFDKYVTSSGNRALDFGAGTGQSTMYLKNVGFDADGVDIDSNMLAKAKELDVENADKYQVISNSIIPHRKSKYDLVFSTFVLLELGSKEEIFNYFSEAYRVMKFDGCLVALTVNDDFYKHQWASIDTNYPGNAEARSGDKVKVKIKEVDLELSDFYWTKNDYKELAEKAGFTILEELEPKGSEKDKIDWISEREWAPYVIFVMKKTKSLENNNNIAMANRLDIRVSGRGIFAEIDRDKTVVRKEDLPQNYSGDRDASATIRLLMRPGDFWPFHKLKSKEVFRHVEGNDLIVHCINKNGKYSAVYLGEEHDSAVKEFIVPPECWYAEEVCGKNGYALIEAKTIPAFHPDDQEEATREGLLSLVNEGDDLILDIINRLHPCGKNLKKSFGIIANDSPLFAVKEGKKEVETFNKLNSPCL